MRAKKNALMAVLTAVVMMIALLPSTAHAQNSVSAGTAQELYDAFGNAGDGDVITMTSDINYSGSELETIVVANDVTLDFNGFSITADRTLFEIESGTLNLVDAEIESDSYVVYENDGTLNVQSTAGNGICCDSYVVYCNNENGTVNISNAVIEAYEVVDYNYGDVTISETKFTGSDVVYYNYGNATLDTVEANIDDAVMSYNYGKAVFTDMTVVSEDYAFPVEDQYDDYYEDYGIPSTTINGGTFTGPYMNCCMYCDCVINGATFNTEDCMDIYSYYVPTNVIVNDGDFTADGDCVFYVGGDAATLTINGGTFKTTGTSGEHVIDVGYEEDTVILTGGTFSTEDGTEALDSEYDYSNYIIPRGYKAIPAGWKETPASELTIVPCDPATVDITAKKILDGGDPAVNSFVFVLKDENGETVQTQNNTGNAVTFDTLSFSEEGTFVYTLSEAAETGGYVYDNTVYTITIVVTLPDDEDYTAAVTYEKDGEAYSGELVFENTSIIYKVSYKWTGDIPEGVTLPIDSTEYHWHDVPAADKTYTNDTSIEGVKDGVPGTYSFSGWTAAEDLTNGIESNITFQGKWTFTPAPEPEPEPKPEPAPEPEPVTPAPNTGDNSNLFINLILVLISGSALICAVVFRRKNEIR